MKKNRKYYRDPELENEDDDDIEEGYVSLRFRILKGKVNRNPGQFVLNIKEEYCTEVRYEGRDCFRVLNGSPAEFKAFVDFCKQYLGDFPAKSPYVYIPKEVIMPQPKKKKKSLFKN